MRRCWLRILIAIAGVAMFIWIGRLIADEGNENAFQPEQIKRYGELCSSIDARIATNKGLSARSRSDPRAQNSRDHDLALFEAQNDRDAERSLLEALQSFCDVDARGRAINKPVELSPTTF